MFRHIEKDLYKIYLENLFRKWHTNNNNSLILLDCICITIMRLVKLSHLNTRQSTLNLMSGLDSKELWALLRALD